MSKIDLITIEESNNVFETYKMIVSKSTDLAAKIKEKTDLVASLIPKDNNKPDLQSQISLLTAQDELQKLNVEMDQLNIDIRFAALEIDRLKTNVAIQQNMLMLNSPL